MARRAHELVIARVKDRAAFEAALINGHWASQRAPGFLRAYGGWAEHDLYFALTEWEDERAHINWTTSDAFLQILAKNVTLLERNPKVHIFHFDSEVDFSAGVTEVFLGYLDAETTDIPAFKSVADKGKDFIEAGPKRAVGFLSEVHARDEKLQEHAQYGKTKALGVFTQWEDIGAYEAFLASDSFKAHFPSIAGALKGFERKHVHFKQIL